MSKKDEDKKFTKITIADFEVASNKADLRELEECMNRLIQKNKHFADVRRRKAVAEHFGMCG